MNRTMPPVRTCRMFFHKEGVNSTSMIVGWSLKKYFDNAHTQFFKDAGVLSSFMQAVCEQSWNLWFPAGSSGD